MKSRRLVFEQARSRLLKAALLSQTGICDASNQLSLNLLLSLTPHPCHFNRKAKMTTRQDDASPFLGPHTQCGSRVCVRVHERVWKRVCPPPNLCSGCLLTSLSFKTRVGSSCLILSYLPASTIIVTSQGASCCSYMF